MTLTTYTDIQIRVRALNEATDAYPVEATLDDGSHFPNGELRLDRQALLKAELDPEQYGLALFYGLFSGPIRRAYDMITGRAQVETDGRVRVRLWIDRDAAELHALPWERLVHLHKGQPVPLSTSTRTPFSRYTDLEIPDPQPVDQRPVRLLFAIANPSNLPASLTPIPVQEEVENLRQVLGDLRRGDERQVTLLPGRSGLPPELQAQLEAEGYQIADGVTSLENILRLLPGCHVLHFLGHGHFRRERQTGEGTAALYLEEADGSWAAVRDEELVGRLANVDPQPHLVFLAACESAKREADAQNPFVGLGPKLVQAGVPAVVAMQDPVPMDLARQLTGDFYRLLLEHGVVDRALNEARNLLFKPNEFSWAIPVLFMRLKDGRLFAKPEPAPPRRRLRAPRPPDYFAGRVDEGERLCDRLTAQPDAAVTVAIQGVGGQGKSAMAQKLGQQLEAHFPGGVLWVDVGQGAEEAGRRAEIVNRIALALALDLKDEPLPEKREAIVRSELGREGRLLAILDDVWEVDAGRWLRERVLPDGSPVLLTSRDLGVCKALASHVEPLRGLPMPDGLRLLANLLGELGRYEERARELVILLDGHALALELAARQTLSGPRGLGRIKAQLERTPSLDVLTLEGEERRNTSVARCFLLSYQRLDAEQQRRYRTLGIFAQAPFDLAALAEVWGEPGDGDSLASDLAGAEEVATWLVRRGLLTAAEDHLPAGVELELPVYAQHALLRRYVLALLTEAGEVGSAAARHAAHYRRLPAQSWQLAEIFWPQVAHAWGWVDGQSLDDRLDFLDAIRDFAHLRGLWEPMRPRAKALLAELGASGERPADRASLSANLGDIAGALGDQAQALAYYEQALPLYRQLGDKGGEARTLNDIGLVYGVQGDQAQALEYYEQALPLYRQVGDKRNEAAMLNNTGLVYGVQGDPAQALQYYEQALRLLRQEGDKGGEAATLNNIGGAYSALGDKAQALQYYEQARSLVRQEGDKGGEAQALNNIGGVYSALGDQARALTYLEQALPLARQMGDKVGEARMLKNMGRIYVGLGDLARAEQMLMRTVELDEATGYPDLESDRAELEAVRKRLQVQEEFGRRLLPLVRQAREGDQALVAEVAPLLEQFATQEDAPGLRILGRVLLQLLAGETAPDLASLPPELAGAVGAAFDLPEP